MEKPIFRKPTARDVTAARFILLDGEGVAVQFDPDISTWRGTEADYHGPAQCVDRDTVARVLALDPSPTIEEGHFIVRKGRNTVTVPFGDTMDPQDFPLPDYREDDVTRLALPGFAAAVQKVKYAAATGSDEVRQYLKGVALVIRNGIPSVVGCDGHRLHRVTLAPIAHDDSLDGEFIFPPAAVPHLDADIVAIDCTPKRVQDRQAMVGDLIINRVDGSYPQFERVIPKNDGLLSVSRADLLEWLQLWMKTLPDGGKIRDNNGIHYQPIELVWSDGELRGWMGKGEDAPVDLGLSLPVTHTTRGRVAVSSKYLVEALKACTGHSNGTVDITFREGDSATTSILIDGEAVIMPVRV